MDLANKNRTTKTYFSKVMFHCQFSHFSRKFTIIAFSVTRKCLLSLRKSNSKWLRPFCKYIFWSLNYLGLVYKCKIEWTRYLLASPIKITRNWNLSPLSLCGGQALVYRSWWNEISGEITTFVQNLLRTRLRKYLLSV